MPGPGSGTGAMNISTWTRLWRNSGQGVQQVCAVALAATGTFALASLIPFLAAGRPSTARFPLNVLYAPAWFLFDSFLWFGLLIPVLCYVYVFVLYSDRVTREVMASLVAAGLFLPVLGALSHVLLAEDGAFAAVALVEAFGRVPAAILLILILMLESVAFFALLKRWREHARRTAAEQPPDAQADTPAAPAAPAPDAAQRSAARAMDEDEGKTVEPGGVEAPVRTAVGSPHYANGAAQPYLNGTAHRHVNGVNGAAPAYPDGVTPHVDGVNGMAPPPAGGNEYVDEPEYTAHDAAAAVPGGPPSPAGEPPLQHALPEEPAAAEAPATTELVEDAAGALDLAYPDGSEGEPNPVAFVVPAEHEAQAEPAPAAKPAAKPRSGRLQRRGYSVPLEILDEHESEEPWQVENDTREAAATLMATLGEFRIDAEVTGVRRGPVITMFEILPAPGVKISRIVNLADNIALRLAASRVRIVAPIPGKHAVGIEVPNRHRAVVGFRDLVSQKAFRPAPRSLVGGVPIALGKDITGETQVIDLTATPHLLIAGATGAGKSVLVNTLICSILYSRTPEQVRLLLIDPKIVELKLYNDVPHLLTPVITDPKRAFQALQYCLYEMERRYALLDHLGVRDIRSYNRKLTERDDRLTHGPLPYLVIVIDEFADLMATTGKELEATLARLAAMARAVGIHIVLATQRPSIDVITGLIKANIPSRIAFMVASKFDSRIIIDAVGAEKLLGRGDMLFVPAWDANPLRIQGALVSEEEVERVTEKVRELGEPDYIDEDILFDDEESELVLDPGAGDPMMEQALEIVAGAGKASASYLQRKLKIGYNRAARLVEEMEQRGIVGPANGSKPREILHLPNRDKT